MGRHLTNNTTALHEPVAVTITGDAVTVGDYVRVEASGMGRRAVDGLSLATQNTAAGVTALAGLGHTAHVAAANYGGTPVSGRMLATLGNGNVACLHTGNGTTASTAITCRIYTPLKASVAVIAVTAAASINAFRVIKLNASNFAVVWGEGAALMLAVYTNAGAVVLAATSVGTIAGPSTMSRWAVAALANGDLVVAYDKTSSGGMAFVRYNASGVLQGTEVIVEAAVAADYMCVLPLAAGGFWVYYYRSTATAAYKFARYNAAGVLQGALTTVFTGSGNLSTGIFENYAIELSNGSVALVDPTTSTTSAVRLYDSAGTFLATVTNNTGLTNAVNMTLLRAKAGGGFYMAVFGGLIAQYDNAGNRVASGSAPNALATRNEGVLMDRAGTGPALFYAQDNSGTGAVAAIAYDGTLTAEATALTVFTTASATYGLWAELMPCGLVAFTFCNSGITGVSVHGRVAPQAASVLGIAISAGSDGQAVSVATAGRWRANQTMPAVSFDRRSSAPVGCKAVITGGTQAVLLGIVA